MYFNFKAMPALLKLVSVICVFELFLSIAVVLPFANFRLGETEVSFTEFWSHGAGLLCFVVGIALFIVGIAILLQKGWARYLLVVLFVLPLITRLRLLSLNEVTVYFASCIPVVWYLFIKKNVIKYFDINNARSKTMPETGEE